MRPNEFDLIKSKIDYLVEEYEDGWWVSGMRREECSAYDERGNFVATVEEFTCPHSHCQHVITLPNGEEYVEITYICDLYGDIDPENPCASCDYNHSFCGGFYGIRR